MFELYEMHQDDLQYGKGMLLKDEENPQKGSKVWALLC